MAAGDWKEMILAVQQGDLSLVEYHINMGVDPNYQHPEFLTAPLLESIRFGQLEVARFLLEHGADPNVKEIFDASTPLSIAHANKDQAAIDLLEAYGAEKYGKQPNRFINFASPKNFLKKLFRISFIFVA